MDLENKLKKACESLKQAVVSIEMFNKLLEKEVVCMKTYFDELKKLLENINNIADDFQYASEPQDLLAKEASLTDSEDLQRQLDYYNNALYTYPTCNNDLIHDMLSNPTRPKSTTESVQHMYDMHGEHCVTKDDLRAFYYDEGYGVNFIPNPTPQSPNNICNNLAPFIATVSTPLFVSTTNTTTSNYITITFDDKLHTYMFAGYSGNSGYPGYFNISGYSGASPSSNSNTCYNCGSPNCSGPTNCGGPCVPPIPVPPNCNGYEYATTGGYSRPDNSDVSLEDIIDRLYDLHKEPEKNAREIQSFLGIYQSKTGKDKPGFMA